MSKGPRITIITACYNAETTIEQTILSVINQTYSNLEYIIIDGASTDRTMDIVNKYKGYINVVISEPDAGIYEAFNKGVFLSTGDFINFMNADDYFATNDIVEEVANYLKDYQDTVMIHGNVKAFDEHSGHWHFRGESLTLTDFINGKMCPHQSVFTRKSLFHEMGGFDLSYRILADVDFTIKCFQKYEHQIVYLPWLIAYFRLGGISSSLVHEKKTIDENAAIHQKHFQCLPSYIENYRQNYASITINQYYVRWLESLLLGQTRIISCLSPEKQESIYIFGTKNNATLLYHNLTQHGAKVAGFLDNNQAMQGEFLHGLPITSPRDLGESIVDTIIVSIERPGTANEVKTDLVRSFPNATVFAWFDFF